MQNDMLACHIGWIFQKLQSEKWENGKAEAEKATCYTPGHICSWIQIVAVETEEDRMCWET